MSIKRLLFMMLMGLTAMLEAEMPKSLYKVVSEQEWEKSQKQGYVVLGEMDTTFIHLATEDQLKRITDKYWSHVSQYVTLKLDPRKLQGRLVLEANPGGENKYYHLYDGSIPLDAVLESIPKN